MNLKIGTILHYKQYDLNKGNPCYAALLIANDNGVMTLEITDDVGHKFIRYGVSLLPNPTTVLVAHEISICAS